MDLLSPRPYWPIKDGLPASYPALSRNVRCQVAVIGAGVTGALVAWHLADAGIETVVLDRREVAHGSTAGSTSLLQYEIDVPLHELEERLGLQRAQDAYHDCLGAVRGIGRLVKKLRLDCGFEFKGSLLLAHRAGHVGKLRREFEARRAAGFSVEWWPRGELARRSTLPHAAALHSRPGEAAQVDAYAFTHGLLAAAVRKGAQVFDRSGVTRRRTSPRGIELTTQCGATVRAQWLVIASGYEADQFLPQPVTALHSTFAMISEPLPDLPGWPEGTPVIWDTGQPYLYLRTTADRRIIMGGYDEPFRDPRKRDRLLPAKVSALRRRFRQLLPRIKFEVATAWAGTFGETPDGLPFIGEHPGVPRTWFALGYGGNGITYSLIAAELFRDRLTEGVTRDMDLYGFGREKDLKH